MYAAAYNWRDELGVQYLSLVPPGQEWSTQVRRGGLIQRADLRRLPFRVMRRPFLSDFWFFSSSFVSVAFFQMRAVLLSVV